MSHLISNIALVIKPLVTRYRNIVGVEIVKRLAKKENCILNCTWRSCVNCDEISGSAAAGIYLNHCVLRKDTNLEDLNIDGRLN
jgi:hypothetical protein